MYYKKLKKYFRKSEGIGVFMVQILLKLFQFLEISQNRRI